MSIIVKNLVKLYGEQRAVDQLSFEANRGEIVGFLGPNGAGKSTTMKIITGYLQPDAGSALVGGMDVTEHPMETRRMLGYLPESNALYYDMYVREYLEFTGSLYKVPHLKKAVEESMDMVGLQPEGRKKIGQLSKGYKQRVGLAAALIHQPQILILDEPTSGLDPNQILEIRAVLKQLGKEKTVLLSTHIMQEVEAICNRVLIINKGKLVADQPIVPAGMASKKPSVRVSFQEMLEAAPFENLPDAGAVHQIDAHTWQIETSDASRLRKQLLQMSIDQNLNILSLQEGAGNLEEIFRNVTAQKPL